MYSRAVTYAFRFDARLRCTGFIGDGSKLKFPWPGIRGQTPCEIAGEMMQPFETAMRHSVTHNVLGKVRLEMDGIPRVVHIVPLGKRSGCIALVRWSHPALAEVAQLVLEDQGVSLSEVATALMSQLTKQQQRVLSALAEPRATAKSVAHKLKLSQRTVEQHRAAALRRLGFGSMSELLKLVVQR